MDTELPPPPHTHTQFPDLPSCFSSPDKPGMLDMKGQAKWEAWNSRQGNKRQELSSSEYSSMHHPTEDDIVAYYYCVWSKYSLFLGTAQRDTIRTVI